ncbi:MAG TPA: low molecular weight protein tyrosine phosphatase family protein [Rhizomicrobium sp.]|jgi:predicted protein tyrosine phosphatase|nr:low molecular weight protein tyrosine phosphatase family protein [Rhizomicrobium sp.]
MKNILFVCGKNRRRSPTAEQIFASDPNFEVASAGISADADNPLTPDLVEWANIIFVMENAHRQKLAARFRTSLKHARVICLDIPDNYAFMAPELVQILKTKVTAHLR